LAFPIEELTLLNDFRLQLEISEIPSTVDLVSAKIEEFFSPRRPTSGINGIAVNGR
jgi:hypothetical protein